MHTGLLSQFYYRIQNFDKERLKTKKITKMKKSHVIDEQEVNYWAELYSANLKCFNKEFKEGFIKGFKEGFKEGYNEGYKIGRKKWEKMFIERLIEDGGYNLEGIAGVLDLPLSEIIAIKDNMNISVS